ncbi:hypothetical protein HDU93_004879, partial [Gonapodya sp. JEL0774]
MEDGETPEVESISQIVELQAEEKAFVKMERDIFTQTRSVLVCPYCKKTGSKVNKGQSGNHIQNTMVSLISVKCDLKGCGKSARLKEVLGATPGCSVPLARWSEGFKSLTGGDPSLMNPGKPSATGSRGVTKTGGSKAKSAPAHVQGNTLDRFVTRPPPASTSRSSYPDHARFQEFPPPTPTLATQESATQSWADMTEQDEQLAPTPNQPSRAAQQSSDDEKTRLLSLLEQSNKRQTEMQRELTELRLQIDRLTRELAAERSQRIRDASGGNTRGVGGRHVPGA